MRSGPGDQPIRAGIADKLEGSDHTSVQQRSKGLRKDADLADRVVEPVAGPASFPRVPLTHRQYIDLVNWTGRQIRPGKRGKIAASEPPALRRLGLDPEHWTGQVCGIGSGYRRFAGSAETLLAKAAELGQRWVKGIGLARSLAATR